MKFHFDEHIAEAVAVGLRRRGLDVTTTYQAGLLGAEDVGQLAYSLSDGRVMVSHDPDMLRLATSGVVLAGIAYCHHQKYKTGEFIRQLLALSARLRRSVFGPSVQTLFASWIRAPITTIAG